MGPNLKEARPNKVVFQRWEAVEATYELGERVKKCSLFQVKIPKFLA